MLDAMGIKPIPLFMLSSWIKAAAKCGFNVQPLFKEAGITIPRAQLDVRMYDAAGRIIGSAPLPSAQHEESAKRSAGSITPKPFGN